MLLNVKKMKKHIAVFAVVAIVAIATIGTTVSALAAENTRSLQTKQIGNSSVPASEGIDLTSTVPAEGNAVTLVTEGTGAGIYFDLQDVKRYNLAEEGQLVYFDTQEELDAHLELLKERREKGLNLYEGFEELYAHIDFNQPVFGYAVRK